MMTVWPPTPQGTRTQPAPATTRDSPRERPKLSSWRGMPSWRRMSQQAWLRRLALAAIAALAGLLYAWAMGQDTLEYYYAAADRSMSMSWHNFIFGAFDPAGTITVDKLPGALWIQALSVRAFGLHTWAIILPQVIEGILTVLMLYRAVRRLAGPAAGLIAALVSVSWMTAVSLVPAADRPYADGSHDNSVFEQVFAYNGFGRFGDQTPLQVRAAELDPAAVLPVPARAADRLLRGSLGLDTGWLIPAAAVVAVWGIASQRRQPRGDPLRACFILWGGWLVTFFAVFSMITTLWPYYTAALSPPTAAIIGTGVAAARSRERAPVSRTIGLAVIVAGTAAYAAWLVSSSARAPGWLVPAIIAVGIAATGLIVWSLAGRRSVPFATALVAGLVAVSLAPAVASVSLAAHSESAFDTPFESARVQEAVALGLGKQAAIAVQATIPEWQDTQNGAPYLMAAQSAALPSLIIYDTGLEALPIGGFDGTTPSPTLAQLQADIRQGLFHLVWIDSGTDPRLRWITARCTQISKRFYDCVPANAG